MRALLLGLAADHSLGFVLVASTICIATGWLLSVLMQQAERTSGRTRRVWMSGIVVVAGVGVWTTHFLAMLGYRGDLALTYDPIKTALSAVMAALAVGLPLAATVMSARSSTRMLFGGLAGLGISLMHASGMAALQGCIPTHTTSANILAASLGAAVFAVARGSSRIRASRVLTCLAVTVAVTGAHFVSIAGTTLEPLNTMYGIGAQIPSVGNQQNIALSVFTAAGAAVVLIGTVLAIVAARRFDAQQEAHSATLTTALQNMSNGILTISAEGRIELFNWRLLEMLALNAGDVARDMPLERFLANVGRTSGWDAARIARVVANHRVWMAAEGATHVDHQFDDGRIVSVTCQPVGGGAVLTYDDVTADRTAKKQIMDLAFKDPLTGLANRRALRQRMEDAIASHQPFALLLVDVDRFKDVNDTYGHSAGDQLLVQVAQRVRHAAGSSDFVARLGGDEMAILVFDGFRLARMVAGRIVTNLAEPFAVGETTVVIGGSVGLCSSSETESVEELMQRADLALYESKRCGRGRATAYQPGMLEAVAKRNQLETDLREALRRRQFHMVYQPVMSLHDDSVIAYEALIRWNHPVHGAIEPSQFIPIAEETGQILEIGAWVLDEACREAMTWPGGQRVAVNVSPVQLRSPTLFAQLAAALARSGLPANRLEVELTETSMVQDGAHVAHVLTRLRGLGVKVAMDDFGTGYSSLAHLRDMPLDRIKIDRSFVAAAETDLHCMAVLKAVTQMGRDMAIETLAEGVETQSQLKLLTELGCDAAQGYLIGRPQRLSPTPADAVVRAA